MNANSFSICTFSPPECRRQTAQLDLPSALSTFPFKAIKLFPSSTPLRNFFVVFSVSALFYFAPMPKVDRMREHQYQRVLYPDTISLDTSIDPHPLNHRRATPSMSADQLAKNRGERADVNCPVNLLNPCWFVHGAGVFTHAFF